MTAARTEALLDRARSGDDDALLALLEAVQPQVYRFGLQMCRQPEDAEDVLQDTLLTLARSFRDFRGASSLSTWLYTITRSVCIKRHRQSKYAPDVLTPIDDAVIEDAAPRQDSVVEHKQTWAIVAEAIRALPEDQREVLILRDVEGLSTKAVAEVVDESESAVKSRLHRARGSLRATISGHSCLPKRPECPDIRTIFSEHLEGTLAPEVCTRMEQHLSECPTCAAECAGLRETLSICSRASTTVPPDIQARITSCVARVLNHQPQEVST